jgi:N-formylglutamate amidohydrolase
VGPTFSVVEPSAEETPVIVEIPHAGLGLDPGALASISAPARSIGRDADLWVDELYAEAPAQGASMIVAHVSRYVVDMNRGPTDFDAESVEGGAGAVRATRGVIWRLTSESIPILDAPLPRQELERRLDAYYHPYHRALTELIEKKRARFGHAIVVAGHSMPSVDRAAYQGSASGSGNRDLRLHRADVVPGTRGRTSAGAAFIDAVDAQARHSGFSVAHDEPYAGGFTTVNYGKPAAAVHVVQVELARRLYMNETTLQKNTGFSRVRAFCTALVGRMARVRP